MNLEYCDCKMSKTIGTIEFNSAVIGKVLVPKIKYEFCERCGDKFLTPTESKKVTAYVKTKEQEAIDALPIGDFISSGDAADILGISKQAFSKNPKIKRGLIMSSVISNYRYYLKESVIQFKETDNGKFVLPGYEPDVFDYRLAIKRIAKETPWITFKHPTVSSIWSERSYELLVKDTFELPKIGSRKVLLFPRESKKQLLKKA